MLQKNDLVNQETVVLHYSSNEIPVHIYYEVRERMRITVWPDNTVVVKAPQDREPQEVQLRIKARLPWISKQLKFFDQYQPSIPEPGYVSGETHLYLGRQYRLQVISGQKNYVKLIGKYFQLTTNQPENAFTRKRLLDKWYAIHAKKLINNRSASQIERIMELGGKQPQIHFRRMKKRWGSCTPSGKITFNTELIKSPIDCIDYVIIHELCHLVYGNHNPNFYQLLDNLMPDWRKRKERLEKVVLR